MPERDYSLCGAILHHGEQVETGHYTSVTKDETGKWTMHDDGEPPHAMRSPYSDEHSMRFGTGACE